MTTATIPQIYNTTNDGNNINPEVSRQEIQDAIAKAVELRALHAALVQGNISGSSPANVRFPVSSPALHSATNLSAQDYPVFTPVSIVILIYLKLISSGLLFSPKFFNWVLKSC